MRHYIHYDLICFSPADPDLKLAEDRLFYVGGKSPRSNNSSSTEEGNYLETLHFLVLCRPQALFLSINEVGRVFKIKFFFTDFV